MSKSKAKAPRAADPTPSTPPMSMPSLVATRRSLGDFITLEAIAAYEEALRARDAYRESVGNASSEDEEVDKWHGSLDARAEAAARNVVRTLVVRSSELGWDEARKADRRIGRTCGVISHGRLYLAAVDAEHADDPIGELTGEEVVMRLIVADMAEIADLDAPGAGEV